MSLERANFIRYIDWSCLWNTGITTPGLDLRVWGGPSACLRLNRRNLRLGILGYGRWWCRAVVSATGEVMKNRITFWAVSARTLALLAATSWLIGCAVVKINPDSTDSVEHSGGADVGRDLATRVCKKAKARGAEVIGTVKKDDKAPEGKGRSVTTFRCRY